MRNRWQAMNDARIVAASKIEAEVVAAICLFDGKLPAAEVRQFIYIARHAECAVAFEGFCDQLYEHQVPLDEETYLHLHGIAQKLRLNIRYITNLQSLVLRNAGDAP